MKINHLSLLALIITLSSCYKSEFTNAESPNPSQGSTEVKIDTKNLPDDMPTDAFTIDQDDNSALVYNTPSGIIITNGVATLDEATRVAQDPEPMPEDLYYGFLPMVELQEVSIAPERGNAMLTLQLSYEQSEVENVREITASLSGIAATKDLHTDALSDMVSLTHYPEFGTASPLELKFNIFGTMGDEQILTLTYTTTSGETKVVTSDLSSKLTDFNSKMEALTITGDMNLPADLDTEAKIDNWTTENIGSETAD